MGIPGIHQERRHGVPIHQQAAGYAGQWFDSDADSDPDPDPDQSSMA
jgi:hypothetical protein